MSRGKTGIARRLAAPLRLAVVLVLCFPLAYLPAEIVARMGIRPRLEAGLWGVVFHPLLHFGGAHLLANLAGLLLFGTLVALVSVRHFHGVVASAWLGGGLLTWLIAAPGTVTGGASGLVYGLLGFLFSHGLLAGRVVPLVLSLASVWLFHQQLWGLLPGQAGVSWQCHLAGFLAGTGWAWLTRNRAW